GVAGPGVDPRKRDHGRVLAGVRGAGGSGVAQAPQCGADALLGQPGLALELPLLSLEPLHRCQKPHRLWRSKYHGIAPFPNGSFRGPTTPLNQRLAKEEMPAAPTNERPFAFTSSSYAPAGGRCQPLLSHFFGARRRGRSAIAIMRARIGASAAAPRLS